MREGEFAYNLFSYSLLTHFHPLNSIFEMSPGLTTGKVRTALITIDSRYLPIGNLRFAQNALGIRHSRLQET